MTTSTTSWRASTRSWWHSPLARAAATGVVLLLLAWTWIDAAPPPNNVEYFPLNGAFQNYNPLRRMRLGQVPGADFQMYLGLGVNALMSAALGTGQTLAASLFTTRLLCGWLFIGQSLLLGYLARLPWLANVAVATVIALHASGMGPVSGPDALSGLLAMFHPGNSVLGLRCALPFLSAAAILAAAATPRGRRWLAHPGARTVMGGLLGGLQLAWSNDYGLPSTAALGALVLVGMAPKRRWRSIMGQAAIFTALALGVATACVMALTHGHAGAWWAYNTQGVAADQFWYFQGDKLLQLRDLPMQPVMLWMLLTVALLLLQVWHRPVVHPTPRSLRTPLLATILLSCVMAGYLSSSGSLSSHYFAPAKWVTLYPALLFARAAGRAWQRGLRPGPWLRHGLRLLAHGPGQAPPAPMPPGYWLRGACIVAGGGMLLSAAILAGLAAPKWLQQVALRRAEQASLQAPPWVTVPELGGALPARFDKMVALGRELATTLGDHPASERVFSTYASGLDVVAGAVQPTGFDYIIHALGPGPRAAYVNALAQGQPPYVTTLRETFTFWETWVRRMHWDFYRELLTHYRPVDQTFYNTLWQRSPGGIVDSWGAVTCEVDGHDPFVTHLTLRYPPNAPNPEVRWTEVTLRYRTQMRLNRLWNGTLRQLVRVEEHRSARGAPFGSLPVDINTFQLPPGTPEGNQWRFLVEVDPNLPALLEIDALPAGIVNLQVDGCEAQDVVAKARIDDFALPRLHPAARTDQAWQQGISTGPQAGVRVSDASDLRHLRVGQSLQLPDGTQRRIDRIEADTVWLQGPALNAQAHGYPHAWQVLLQREAI